MLLVCYKTYIIQLTNTFNSHNKCQIITEKNEHTRERPQAKQQPNERGNYYFRVPDFHD